MKLRNSKDVIGGVTVLGERAIRQIGDGYQAISDPVVDAIESAKGFGDLKKRMSKRLINEMDSTVIEESLETMGTQAGLIGVVSATPIKMSKVESQKTKV